MKTTVKALKERLNIERKEIIDASQPEKTIFNNNQEENLINGLFDEIESQTDFEEFVSVFVDNFTLNHVLAKDVFEVRSNPVISNYISEILCEMDKTLDSTDVSSIDKIFNNAGYRYLDSIANSKKEELLSVYLIDNVYNKLLDFDENTELDASEYGEYEDENALLFWFVDELLTNVSSHSRILELEDCPEEILEDFFQLEF